MLFLLIVLLEIVAVTMLAKSKLSNKTKFVLIALSIVIFGAITYMFNVIFASSE